MTNPANRLLLNPYLHLAISAVLLSFAEVLLKTGADASADGSGAGILGFSALAFSSTWIGIVLYVLSFLSWLYVLRIMPLTRAYALINVVHILVPITAWVFLGEQLSAARIAGICLVLGGTLLVAAPAAAVEHER